MFAGGQQIDTTIHNPVKVIHNVTAGHYEVQPEQISWGAKLGEGAMAQIFRAKIKLPSGEEQMCVAKKLKSGTDSNTQAYKDLVMELDILTSVQKHPNLVQFYGACIKDTNNPIILEEWVEGPNLEDFLSKRAGKRLPKPTLYKWSMDLLRALDFLHNRNPIIIHRDLKPANLILTKDLELMKLADFGMSKKVDSAMRLQSTHKGHTGTLRYMAPEVANQRTGMYTEKVDIYGAALIMWYMSTCMRPDLNKQDPRARPGPPHPLHPLHPAHPTPFAALRLAFAAAMRPCVAALMPEKTVWLLPFVGGYAAVCGAWSDEPEQRPSASLCIQQMTAFPDKPLPHEPVAPNQGCACAIM